MPRSGIILRVFAASPNDVAEERAILEDVVRELNIVWSKNLGIYLELIKWETHAFPGIASDAQALINEQIADDYDVFIGIMWARFGTATGRAGSGTAEEFYRAYNRYKTDSNQVRIMFYFKDAAISPSELDPDQLAAMKVFQEDLGEKGTHFWTYTSREEFAQLIRMHLGRQIQDYGKVWGLEIQESDKDQIAEKLLPSEIENPSIYEELTEFEEEGFLDLLVVGQEEFESMIEVLTRMTVGLQDLGNRVHERTKELDEAKTPDGNIDAKQAKRISNRVADEMNNFAALMEVEVPIFGKSFTKSMEAYTRAFAMSNEMASDDKEDVMFALEANIEFQGALSSARSQMQGFRQTIADLPRATIILNKAKRRLVSIMDTLDDEMTTAMNLTSEMEKVTRRILSH